MALSVTACAGAGREIRPDPLRIAASHYQSMNGVALQSGIGPMTCNREAITGSHILRWYCRFDGDAAQYQLSNPIHFVVR